MKVAKKDSPWVGIEAKTGYYPGMAGLDRVKATGGLPAEEGRRRRGRILGRKGQEAHCYHLMSRTCGGEVFFDDVEKEALVKLIGKMARFGGVEVLTYCVMGNHFHLLVRVPDKDLWMTQFDGAAGEAALLAHLGRFYSRSFMDALRAQLAEDRRQGDEVAAQGRLSGFRERLCDVSQFMQELKTRFTKWYNKRHGRRGTLWMERFKSVLVEGRRRQTGRHQTADLNGGGVDALRAMALYIDLNPVRAGLVEDPAEYRWCGYAAAMGGEKEARRGLMEVTGLRSWARASEAYRMWLFATGSGMTNEECGMTNEECGMTNEEGDGGKGTTEDREKTGVGDGEGARGGRKRKVRHGVAVERRREVLAGRGKMSLGELLRCRVRYFSDGAVIGSREFVAAQAEWGGAGEGSLQRKRRRLGAGILTAGRVTDARGLFSLRDLRIDAVVPAGRSGAGSP